MSAKVGRHLASRPLRHGEGLRLARELGVSARTLRNWRARALRQGPCRPAHRPLQAGLHGPALRRAIRIWRGLPRGMDGARTLRSAIKRAGIALGKRPCERLVAWLRQRKAQHAQRRILANRVHHHVLGRELWWSCDESFLGRDEAGEAIVGLFVREVGSRRTYPLSVGPPASGHALAGALVRLASERGGWPWIVSLDNGAANRAEVVAQVLSAHQVVLLFNLPHTPEHNAFAERAIGEHKRASGVVELGRELDPACPRASRCALLQSQLEQTAWLLDRTPSAALAGLTPLELDSLVPRADDLGCRARFYAETHAALACIAHSTLPRRAQRRAQREAVLSALERHGLLVRTTGGARSTPRWTTSKRNDLRDTRHPRRPSRASSVWTGARCEGRSAPSSAACASRTGTEALAACRTSFRPRVIRLLDRPSRGCSPAAATARPRQHGQVELEYITLTCRPRTCLRDVLLRIAKVSDVRELTPYGWKAKWAPVVQADRDSVLERLLEAAKS